jgi:hypothetical protein
MDFFRSPLLRRIIYALVFLLALMGLYSRLHAEPLDAGASDLPGFFGPRLA